MREWVVTETAIDRFLERSGVQMNRQEAQDWLLANVSKSHRLMQKARGGQPMWFLSGPDGCVDLVLVTKYDGHKVVVVTLGWWDDESESPPSSFGEEKTIPVEEMSNVEKEKLIEELKANIRELRHELDLCQRDLAGVTKAVANWQKGATKMRALFCNMVEQRLHLGMPEEMRARLFYWIKTWRGSDENPDDQPKGAA